MAIIEEDIIDQTKSTIEEVQAGQTLGPTEMATGPGQEENVQLASLRGLLNIAKPPKGSVLKKTEELVEEDVEKKIFKPGETIENIGAEDILEPKAVGDPDFNFDYINNVDDVSNVLNVTSSKIKQPESLSFAETEALAKDLDMTPEILQKNFQKGVLFKEGVPIAAQMKAARDTLVTSASKLNDMAIQIAENKKTGLIDQELLVNFRKQMTIHASIQSYVKGAQFEIAQALNAFKIPADASVDKSTLLTNVLSEFGGARTTEELAEKYAQIYATKGNAGVNKLVNKGWFAKTKEAAEEAYIAGLLFNPRTQLRNFIGSSLYLATSVPQDIIAGAAGFATRTGTNVKNYLFKGKGNYYASSDGVFMGEGVARAVGFYKSWGDAWKMAYNSFKTSAPSDASLRVETYRQPKFSAEALGLKGTTGQFVDFLGKVQRLSFDAMLFGDEFVKEVARSGEQYALAYRAMKKAQIEGKSQEEIIQVATDIINDRSLVQTEVDTVAKHFTLQDELGPYMKRVQALQQVPGMRYILPFVKTPTNITKIVSKAAGLGLIDPALKRDPVRFQKAVAQMGLAWGFGIWMFDVAQQGRITGAPPINKKDSDALKATGWKPYSFVFKDPSLSEDSPLFDENGIPTGNHTYVSYMGYEPVGAIIGMAANTFEIMTRSRDEQVHENIAQAFALSTYDYFKSLPALQGIAAINEILPTQYNNQEPNYDKLASIVSNALLPFSSGIRTLESAVDPEIRDPGAEFEIDLEPFVIDEQTGEAVPNPMYGIPKSGTFNSLIKVRNDYLDKLPGSENFFKMPPKLDDYGNDITVNENINTWGNIFNMVSPSTFAVGKDITPEMYEVLRLGNPIANPGRKKFEVPLNSQQYYYWVKTAKGGFVKEDGTVDQVYNSQGLNFQDAMISLINSPTYLSSNENEQYTLLNALNKDFLDLSWDNFFQYRYPEVYNATNTRKLMIEEGYIKKAGR